MAQKQKHSVPEPRWRKQEKKEKKRKKPTLLIPVEQCWKGELQPGTSRREWGRRAARREDLLQRGRCDAGTKRGVTAGQTQPTSPREPGASLLPSL